MTMFKRAALSVAALSLMSVVSFTAMAAPVDTSPSNQNGAFVVLQTAPAGTITFTYGWNNSNQFAAPAIGYWLGIYDVTNSHYIWSGENYLPPPPTNSPGTVDWKSLKLQYSETSNLPAGNYKVVFFVRSGPGTNVGVVEMPFTIY